VISQEAPMRSLSLAIAMLWAPVAAVAQPVNEGKLVTHNGSLMVIINPRPGGMIIQYQDPRPDLFGLVVPGTLLVEGAWRGKTFFGTAFVFSRWCGAIPYAVSGYVDATDSLMLFGPAPIFDTACRILYYSPQSLQAVLRFEPFV
jgi:hypothetical protein